VSEESQMIGLVREKGGALHELAGADRGTTWINMDVVKEKLAAGELAPLTTPKQVLQHEMGHFGQEVIMTDELGHIPYYIREAHASEAAAANATAAADRAALTAHADRQWDIAFSIWQIGR
jgi:hypothetical protein